MQFAHAHRDRLLVIFVVDDAERRILASESTSKRRRAALLFLLLRARRGCVSPGKSRREFLHVVGGHALDRHGNDWIGHEDRFLREVGRCAVQSAKQLTYHADLIGFVVDKRVTSGTIESVERADISGVRLIHFLIAIS